MIRGWQKYIQGVTLISLLVGTALGTFIIIVMLQVFGSSRANYKLAQNLAEMNNIMRYVGSVMDKIISQAGYRTPEFGTGAFPSYETAFPTFSGATYGPEGSEYNPAAYPNSDEPAGVVLSYFPGENVFLSSIDQDLEDKLWVKFQGNANGLIRDCNDLYGVEDQAIKVRFYSRASAVGGSGMAYYCERQNDGEDYVYTDQPTGMTLIPAALFEQAWVRYGEDLTGDGYIDRWALGSDVANRSRVYAVRVAFLIHSRDDVRATEQTQTFEIFDIPVSRTSKKIYKLYTFTVLLKYAPNYRLARTVSTP